MQRSIIRPYRSSEAERSDRTARDRLRHRQKVIKAVKENIADIISEESIIGKDRDRIIKVPIRGIKEHRFIYGKNQKGTAQGDGTSQPGQVVGKSESEGEGKPDKAGDRPGEDYYETDFTLEEMIDLLLEDLELPDMERTKLKQIAVEVERKRKGYRAEGIRVRLDKNRTLRKKLSRKIKQGLNNYPETVTKEDYAKLPEDIQLHYVLEDDELYHQHFSFHDQDLTYRHYDTKLKEQSNAVVICIMDTSGSMDTLKKYLARSFFFLLYMFAKSKYKNVEVVFIAHHTEAKEVTEEEFFSKGESGGTFISSGYNKALDVISERYSPEMWNIYAFHCSDGDNFDEDNAGALKAAEELTKVCNLFGYGEIKPLGSRYYEGSMMELFKKLKAPNFATVLIERKEDVWPSFKSLLEKDPAAKK